MQLVLIRRTRLRIILFTVSVFTASALAQAPNANNLPAATKGMYMLVRNNLVKSAEKMPEENYSFRPTPDVRTYGQIIGHVADAQYLFCSAALGEKNPEPGIEKSKTSKSDLIQALNDAFAYCDKAYNGMTAASAVEEVKFFGQNRPRLSVLDFNSAHDFEHYGNIVTYLRIKGIVPPSSEPRK